MSVILGSSNPKAAKDHRCYLCGEKIPKGTSYFRHSGVEPGDGFWNMKLHPECDSASKKIRYDEWECISEGMFKRGTIEER